MLPRLLPSRRRPQKVYSQEGYDHMSNTEIPDLLRHFPDIINQAPKRQSAFKPCGVSS